MIYFEVPSYQINSEPVIGEVKDGKQKIRLYDRETDNIRTLETTPQKVDEFIKNRKAAMKSQTKKSVLAGVVAAAAGVFCCMKGKVSKANTAAIGALSGIWTLALANLFCTKNADKKITSEFIEANK